jgi:CTP synthase (UTP-ammonia lyase)
MCATLATCLRRGGRRCAASVVGDFQAGFEPHEAIPVSIGHHADGSTVAVDWLPTDTIATPLADSLDSFDGLWIAPGSPYRSLDGALVAIRHARLGNVPLLAGCGRTLVSRLS